MAFQIWTENLQGSIAVWKNLSFFAEMVSKRDFLKKYFLYVVLGE